MTSLTYQQLQAGQSAYFKALAAASDANPGAPLPDVGNYSGNGPNDFWNKAQALAQTYFPQYAGIDFIDDKTAQNASIAQSMVSQVR